MNKYSVRITNGHFSSSTVTVTAENAEEAKKLALYAKHGFYVQWCRRKAPSTKKSYHNYGVTAKIAGVGITTAKSI